MIFFFGVAFLIGVVVMQDANDAAQSDLPNLEGAEAELVSRYPLPDGVPDVEVNKKLLAHALDVSTTTVDAWSTLPDGERIPYVSRGTNGRSYVFRLSVAYAWRQARDAAEETGRRISEDAVAQLRLDLLGGSVKDQARASLSPREQAEALRVEKEWIMAAHTRREFIRASDVAEALESAFVSIRDGLDAAPDRIGRELSLNGPQIESIQKILDAILQNAQADLETKITDD